MSITIDNITLTEEQCEEIIKKYNKKDKYFKAKEREYYVSACQSVCNDVSAFFKDDKIRFSEGNMFPYTEEGIEQAEEYAKYRKALVKVNSYIRENHYFKPDWSDRSQGKFYIFYNKHDNKLNCYSFCTTNVCIKIPYLESAKIAEDIIERFKEELEIIFNYQ